MKEQTLRVMLSNVTKNAFTESARAFVFETLNAAETNKLVFGADETAETLETVRDLLDAVKHSILGDLVYFQFGALVDIAATDFVSLAWDENAVSVSFVRFGKGLQTVTFDFDDEQTEYLLIGAYDDGLFENTTLTQQGYEITVVGRHYYD